MLASCRRLDVSIAPAKYAGPATKMVFLGYELDTVQGLIQLPAEKLARTLTLVKEWSGKKACKQKELESLLGHLYHTATVVRPGRTFVQCLIELLSVVWFRDRWVRLSASTWSDLTWWATFLEGWNGVSMMPRYSSPVITVESDASGGAQWGPQWLQWQWQGADQGWQIAPKELLPILFAVAIWGHQWSRCLVHCAVTIWQWSQ